MKRRQFVTGAGVGAVAADTPAAPALAQSRIEWTMVTPWPKGAPGVGVNAQRVADRITAMSGGRLTVTLSAGGELVPPFESFESFAAVQSGNADMLHAVQSVANESVADFHFHNVVSLRPLVEEHGVELREFNDEIVAELGRVSLEVLDEIGATDPLTARVHASYMAFLNEAVPYSAKMDQASPRQRALAFG